MFLKGTHCLGSDELVYKKAFITVCYKMHIGWKDNLKVEYNDPHKFAAKLRGFPFTVQTYTVGHLWKFDSHKWPTVLVEA